MLRMFWFHFGFKEKADATLMWQWGFFGFKANGTHGLTPRTFTMVMTMNFVYSNLQIATCSQVRNSLGNELEHERQNRHLQVFLITIRFLGLNVMKPKLNTITFQGNQDLKSSSVRLSINQKGF